MDTLTMIEAGIRAAASDFRRARLAGEDTGDARHRLSCLALALDAHWAIEAHGVAIDEAVERIQEVITR